MKMIYRPTRILIEALALLSILSLLSSCKNSGTVRQASGVFEATEVIVSAEADGRILSFPILEGDSVLQGQMMGRIDTIQLVLQRQALLADSRSVLSGRTEVNTQTAAISERITAAERDKARLLALFEAGAVSKKQVDDIDAQINVFRRELTAARANIQRGNQGVGDRGSSITSQIDRIDDRLARTYILAPQSGIVLNKYAQEGELTATGRPLLRMANMREVFLRAYLTAEQLADVRLGQTVQVVADFGSEKTRTYPGRISQIAEKAEFTPKNIQTSDERASLVYAVKITVPNDGFIKLGMYGYVQF